MVTEYGTDQQLVKLYKGIINKRLTQQVDFDKIVSDLQIRVLLICELAEYKLASYTYISVKEYKSLDVYEYIVCAYGQNVKYHDIVLCVKIRSSS